MLVPLNTRFKGEEAAFVLGRSGARFLCTVNGFLDTDYVAMLRGAGVPDTLERIRTIPEIIVHGDADPTVNVSGSRTMVAKLKELGVEHKYIEVPGGLHSDVVAPNIAAIVEFFDAHRKAARSTSQQ